MSILKDVEINWLKTEVIPLLLKNKKLIENFNDKDSKDFHILDIKLNVIGTQEAFMLTSCYKTVLEYEFKGAKNKVHLFVKKTPELSQIIYDNINFNALFNNEILGYEKIIPTLEDFAKIDLNLVTLLYAKIEKNSAVVITEDFSAKGWTVAKDMVNISLDHIILGVRYLAQFHAVGFGLRQQRPELFQKLTKDLKESRYATEIHREWAITLKESIQRALEATRKYEKSVDEKFLTDFNELIGDNYKYGKKLVQPREPLITLCHGDYLRNNVAFKYDADGNPIDSTMFDLQTLRVSSPMVDLSVFLSLSTFAEIRYKHFEQIFTTYCDTLKDTYQKLISGRIPEYLSYNSLLKEYIKFLPYSIGICAAFLMTLVEPRPIWSQEMLMAKPTEEEIINDVITRGGEVVDRELAHQIKELYELNAKYDGNIFEEF